MQSHTTGYKPIWNAHFKNLLILQYWDTFLKATVARDICLLNQRFKADHDTIVSQNEE